MASHSPDGYKGNQCTATPYPTSPSPQHIRNGELESSHRHEGGAVNLSVKQAQIDLGDLKCASPERQNILPPPILLPVEGALKPSCGRGPGKFCATKKKETGSGSNHTWKEACPSYSYNDFFLQTHSSIKP